MADPHVVLLFGGDGSEHRVSVASAQNLGRELESSQLWFWSRAGAVHLVGKEELQGLSHPFEDDLEPEADARWPTLANAFDQASGEAIFFLGLHGGSGENGTVQGWLEERRLRFTGSGAAASRLAFDKVRARQVLAGEGVAVAEAAVIDSDLSSEARERLHRLLAESGRLVLKPVADGSSHGLRFATGGCELDRFLDDPARPRDATLAEVFQEGYELTIGVLDLPEGPIALPCSEVRLQPGRAFDYEGKYLGKGSQEITPAEISEEMAARTQAVAVTAHRALGCRGYSRTDVIFTETGPVFLETNTLPGLTKASFIPQQLEAAGISMADFVERQLALGTTRYR